MLPYRVNAYAVRGVRTNAVGATIGRPFLHIADAGGASPSPTEKMHTTCAVFAFFL